MPLNNPSPDDLRAAAVALRVRASALFSDAGSAYFKEAADGLDAHGRSLQRVADMLSTMAATGQTVDLHRAAFAAGMAMADAGQ